MKEDEHKQWMQQIISLFQKQTNKIEEVKGRYFYPILSRS